MGQLFNRMRSKFRIGTFVALIAVLVVAAGVPGRSAASDAGLVNGYIGKNLAVFDFIPDGAQISEGFEFFSGWISQRLGEQLAGQQTVRVVERQKIAELLAELNLGSSRLTDQRTTLRLGRLLGADYLVFGSYLPIGEQILISAHLVNSASGVVIKAVDCDGNQEQLTVIVDQLAVKLMAGMGLRVQEEELRRTGSPVSREISRYYLQGLRYERQGAIEAAIESYKEVLQRDRDNLWARKAIKRLLDAP